MSYIRPEYSRVSRRGYQRALLRSAEPMDGGCLRPGAAAKR